MKRGKLEIRGSILGLIIMFTVSCVPFNKVRYFTDIADISEPTFNPKEQKLIMPFDNLYIKVLSTDQQTAGIFNFSDDAQSGMPTNLLGYLVNDKGNIIFPFVGEIAVAGLTTENASLKIQTALSQYISNTSIIVKFIDNKFSVLGEVVRQGTYSFTEEKINIYAALSLGGGLTQYGDRSNIVLIRQEGDKILHHKLNISNSKIADKDFYYILNNDIIVVEPMKVVTRSYNTFNFTTIFTMITTIFSLVILSRSLGN